MNCLYNTAIRAYSAAARLAALRSDKVRKMVSGQARSIAHVGDVRRSVAPEGFDLWFHAASLGEFEQARPLIERFRRERPELKILLTFFSPSGYEVRKNYDKVDCVAYLPFDKPALVEAFIDAAAPKRVVFVKYEFWGNFLHSLARRGIPTYLIDAIFRPGQSFFRKCGGMFRGMLRCYTHIFVQDQASKDLLATIGVDNVTVAGDTRFDRVTDVMTRKVSLPQVERWLASSPFTLIVGSSWPGDEERYLPWVNAHQQVRVIIAPHEFDADRLRALTHQCKGGVALWSQVSDKAEIPADTQVLIIDTIGLLSSLYRFGDAAIVGGGFGAGIHNINEAAVYGIPVIFGPNHAKFKEATDLMACSGGYEYSDSRQLAAVLDRCVADRDALTAAGRAAGAYIHDHLGATDRIYPALNK